MVCIHLSVSNIVVRDPVQNHALENSICRPVCRISSWARYTILRSWSSLSSRNALCQTVSASAFPWENIGIVWKTRWYVWAEAFIRWENVRTYTEERNSLDAIPRIFMTKECHYSYRFLKVKCKNCKVQYSHFKTSRDTVNHFRWVCCSSQWAKRVIEYIVQFRALENVSSGGLHPV